MVEEPPTTGPFDPREEEVRSVLEETRVREVDKASITDPGEAVGL